MIVQTHVQRWLHNNRGRLTAEEVKVSKGKCWIEWIIEGVVDYGSNTGR